MAFPKKWTKTAEEYVRQCRMAKVPMAKIANDLNVSKNAVVGKCRDLGLCQQHGPRILPQGKKLPYLWELVTFEYKRANPWK